MREAVVVLEQKGRLRRQGIAYVVPVDRVGKINIEVCDHRPSRQGHVSPRREIRLLHVLQLADESLLRRTTGTGIPFDRTLVDHDRKGKARMSFRLCHNQLCGLINTVVGPIPVDNHAVNSPADHIRDLAMDLICVTRVVADVHVIRASEPQQEMGIDLGGRARIEQRMNVDLADTAGSRVPIALGRKAVRCTCIICRLCGQSGGGDNGLPRRAYTCPRQEQD